MNIPLPTYPGIEFRCIPELDGYVVGNDGTIWSCRYCAGLGMGKGSRSILRAPYRKLQPGKNNGYLYAHLNKNGIWKNYLLHRLVLLAFVGPCPEAQECCHLNGIRSDCRLANLHWATHSSNTKDKTRHGTEPRGEKNPRSKLSKTDISKIRKLYTEGSTQKTIANLFSVHQTQIGRIVRCQQWK